jgi:hypothetical protein
LLGKSKARLVAAGGFRRMSCAHASPRLPASTLGFEPRGRALCELSIARLSGGKLARRERGFLFTCRASGTVRAG